MSSDLAGDACGTAGAPPAFKVKYMARDMRPDGTTKSPPSFAAPPSSTARTPGSGANNVSSTSDSCWAFASGRKCGNLASSSSAFSEKKPAFLRDLRRFFFFFRRRLRPSAGADCGRASVNS